MTKKLCPRCWMPAKINKKTRRFKEHLRVWTVINNLNTDNRIVQSARCEGSNTDAPS